MNKMNKTRKILIKEKEARELIRELAQNDLDRFLKEYNNKKLVNSLAD